MDFFSVFNPVMRPRTAGDGKESETTTAESRNDIPPARKTSLLPGRLIQIYPTNMPKIEKHTPSSYSKSPKFVPYEPYPAAVKPIIPQTLIKTIKRGSKNNMDINTLISQMSQMDTSLNEYKPRAKLSSVSDKGHEDSKLFKEKESMQKKINELQYENEDLKEQLKQQAQVNKELKTMLVASMGEDLETQVQTLNEDKKHLAKALLNSAQHLSTHQEQTEWLAGQCEVWRSKFLASSLMVEELAVWKKILSEKTDELQQALKQLLDERYRTRDMMLCTYKNLYSLHEKWLQNLALNEYADADDQKMYRPIGNLNLNVTSPHSSNILDLASSNLKFSENISSTIEKQDISHVSCLPSVTEGEVHAEHVMSQSIDVKKVNEEPVNALVHHAYSSSGNMPKPIAACVHCNGKVQLL